MQLVLTEPGTSLGKTSERLVVKKNREAAAEIPFSDINFIFVASRGVTLSSDLVQACMERKISIAFLSYSGEPYAEVIAPSDFGKAELRLLQFRARENGVGVALAKAFIEGKLKNQAVNLKYFAKSRRETAADIHKILHDDAEGIAGYLEKLKTLDAPDTDSLRPSLMALEAAAAVRYWNGVKALLPEKLAFTGRENRGAKDLFNASLNYGYGILYAKIWSVLFKAGLDPYSGFIHAYAENRPTLVFDFIEEFRQLVVDRPLIASATKGFSFDFEEEEGESRLSRETRNHIARIVLQRLEEPESYEGKQVKLREVMLQEAYEVARAVKQTGVHKPHIGIW